MCGMGGHIHWWTRTALALVGYLNWSFVMAMLVKAFGGWPTMFNRLIDLRALWFSPFTYTYHGLLPFSSFSFKLAAVSVLVVVYKVW